MKPSCILDHCHFCSNSLQALSRPSRNSSSVQASASTCSCRLQCCSIFLTMHRPSKIRRGITWRQAKAARCPTSVRVGPFHLPGAGYGAIRSKDKAVIKEATGCNIAIRKRPAWSCRMLTLCGPAERITQAKSMAEAFTLRSQQKPPTQMPSMMPQQSITIPRRSDFPAGRRCRRCRA